MKQWKWYLVSVLFWGFFSVLKYKKCKDLLEFAPWILRHHSNQANNYNLENGTSFSSFSYLIFISCFYHTRLVDFLVFSQPLFRKRSVISPSAVLNIYKVCVHLYGIMLKAFCWNAACWWACWDSLNVRAFIIHLAKCWFCCYLLFPLTLSNLHPLFFNRCMKEELILSSLWLASCWRNQPIKSSPCSTLWRVQWMLLMNSIALQGELLNSGTYFSLNLLYVAEHNSGIKVVESNRKGCKTIFFFY